MSTSSSNNQTLVVAAVTGVVAVAATAYVTHYITRKHEDYKHQKFQYETYQRDLLIKEKTALARREQGEPPSGTLIDVRIDRVYMWEVEDLRKRFPGTKIENKMRYKTALGKTRSPLLRKAEHVVATEGTENDASKADILITEYNKLITNHECILSAIIRKPNMQTHSVGYVRAGPRRYLHFDPRNVSAAIVTCGGLCPGMFLL